jgi:hypothetical protein
MSQIGTLITGAGNPTIIPGMAQAEQILVVGSVATANPLQGLQVEIDGIPFININNQPALLSAYAKWQAQFVSTLVGVIFPIATGRIQKNTTYRLTNNGATTPAIYATSFGENGVPFLVGTKQVNASSYEDFENFSALFIGTPANLSSAEVVFMNGCKSTMTFQELDAMFSLQNSAEANGELLAVTVIDNRDKKIRSVRLNCSAANTILVAKLPDPAFQILNK